MRRVALVLAVVALAAPAAAAQARDRVLVLTRAEGFVHDSIPAGVRMLRSAPYAVTVTSDPRRLRGLDRYAALVFLSTTGDVLDAPQQRAVERFVRGGGGWLGIHAAADAERSWSFYQRDLLGARFTTHPPTQEATVVIEDADHLAASGIPQRWTRTDEWYGFVRSPRSGVHVVASLDERTYDPGETRMGDHPIAWWQRTGRGRAFYTALGHTQESYAEPAFRRHVLGALRFVVRRPG